MTRMRRMYTDASAFIRSIRVIRGPFIPPSNTHTT
jgi:hypothetical protein